MQWAFLIAQVLFWVIKTFFFKDIAADVLSATDLIKKVPDDVSKRAYARDLKESVATYKRTRDDRPLKKLLDCLRNHVDGDGPKAA